jgi:uncharacterized membrane protein YphA (DoxX/SURF4 family)
MASWQSRMWRGVSVLLGVAMIAGGAAKLFGSAPIVESFTKWGLPGWFRLLVGTFEVIGGVLIAWPATVPIGGVILATVMVGAMWTHLANNEWSQTAPPGVLLVVFLIILTRSRARAIQLLGGA